MSQFEDAAGIDPIQSLKTIERPGIFGILTTGFALAGSVQKKAKKN